MRSGERTRWPSCKIRIPRSIFTQRRGAAERHDGSLRGSAALRETAFAVAVERLYARGLQLFEQGGELFEVLGVQKSRMSPRSPARTLGRVKQTTRCALQRRSRARAARAVSGDRSLRRQPKWIATSSALTA